MDENFLHPARTKRLGNRRDTGYGGLMGNSQGRDNVKKRAARRKKNDRLAAAAKTTTKKKAKK